MDPTTKEMLTTILFERYKLLKQETTTLYSKYQRDLLKLEKLQAERNFLADKCASIRAKRMKMVDRVPKDPFMLCCQQTKANLRKLHPQALRSEILQMQKIEWDSMSAERKEHWNNEFKQYSKRLQFCKTGVNASDNENDEYSRKKMRTMGKRGRPRKTTGTLSGNSDEDSGGHIGQGKRLSQDDEDEDEYQSSGGGSDSDDNMASLPTGAFG